ncbi:biliverdin-producing heme oxygenase [Marinobacterium mangrovicola]|uniref:Heme oxygenase n=1 Tax=Marinobacterium mangrovicola TaxID=1476959 RepID=A0A4V2PD36_9GAMM|nr:biliverdin-producing heme oxygenase [Marinobacterium mangrovicola]TCK03666.1 heme oxygenase [Marinobacterium mangrovicola]
MEQTQTAQAPLSEALKSHTSSTHERLDRRIMAFEPFGAIERYLPFLRMQLRLNYATASLYQREQLKQWLPDLAQRGRLEPILQDCADLSLPDEQIESDRQQAADSHPISDAEAIGWLYAHQGSSLGAAILLRHAKKDLGLSEEKGARHLAGHADGRGRHWLNFKQQLDALPLSDKQRGEAMKGAENAFAFVFANAETLMPLEL